MQREKARRMGAVVFIDGLISTEDVCPLFKTRRVFALSSQNLSPLSGNFFDQTITPPVLGCIRQSPICYQPS